MEELYLIEFYIKKISIECPPGGGIPAEDKKLTVNIDFGKFTSLTINENEFVNDILQDDDLSDEEAEVIINKPDVPSPKDEYDSGDEGENYEENTKTERSFNAGASLMFAHNPPGLKQTFKLFPLELSVWTNDATERRACVGVAKVMWDSKFIELIGDGASNGSRHDPLTLASTESLRSETTGSIIGEISIFIRLTTLGSTIITRFRRENNDQGFVFRNILSNSAVKCKKYGVNPKHEQHTSYGAINQDWDGADMDVGKIIDGWKSANVGMYAAADQMQSAGPPNRAMVIPCDNRMCKLTELLQSATSDDSRSRNAPKKETCCNAGSSGAKDTEDCCCNCKYLGIPLEKDAIPPFADNQKSVVCEICGGVSYDGKTCKDKDMCSGPCNLDRTEPERDPYVQRMLYEGLTSMLSNARSGNHKKYCSDFKHKSSCPIGGNCCQ